MDGCLPVFVDGCLPVSVDGCYLTMICGSGLYVASSSLGSVKIGNKLFVHPLTVTDACSAVFVATKRFTSAALRFVDFQVILSTKATQNCAYSHPLFPLITRILVYM